MKYTTILVLTLCLVSCDDSISESSNKLSIATHKNGWVAGYLAHRKQSLDLIDPETPYMELYRKYSIVLDSILNQ